MAAVTESQREERIAAVLARAGAASRQWTACRWTPSRASTSARWTWRTSTSARRRTCWRACCRTGSSRAAPPGRAQGARVQPDARRRRLGLAPHHRAGGQRRHALPGRLGLAGDRAPGAVAAPDRASDLRGAARRARRAAVGRAARHAAPQPPRESWMYIEVDRVVDAQQRQALARASSACWPTCAPRSATGSPCWRACTRPPRSCGGAAPRDRDEAQESALS